jgi:hypothetical protein
LKGDKAMSRKIKWKTFFLIMVSSACVILLQSAYGKENDKAKDLLQEHANRIKKVYDFNAWAGKVKIVNKRIDKLEPNFLDAFSEKTKIYTDKKTGLGVDIDIGIKEDAMAAHAGIINFFAVCAAPPPVYKRADPNDPNNPLNIGDVCFYPIRPWIPKKCGKPVLRSLIFCRNNVLVLLRNFDGEDEKEYPNLREIALFIDRKLLDSLKPK